MIVLAELTERLRGGRVVPCRSGISSVLQANVYGEVLGKEANAVVKKAKLIAFIRNGD
jgi:hypothetical protein